MKKVVIVTGGSRGIGKAIVEQLAAKGDIVILNYKQSKQQAKEIKKQLLDKGYIVECYQADISKQEEVKKMIHWVVEQYHRIDVLINNAGIDQYKLFIDITAEEWNQMLNTNLYSAFYTSQEVAKQMIKQKEGCIINISSIWGITGGSCEVHYSVSKAGMDGMTKALAKELAPCNVRVNSIAPGIINTDMNSVLTQDEIEEINNQIPLGRFGEPNSIAKCVEWLIEDDYTTGQVISINGGWLI